MAPIESFTELDSAFSVGREIPAVALLQTVPGIGPYRALLIATETLPIKRLRTQGRITIRLPSWTGRLRSNPSSAR